MPLDWLLEEIKKVENDNLKDLFMCNYFNRWVLMNNNSEALDYSYEKIKARVKNKEYLNKISNKYKLLKEENEKAKIKLASTTKSQAQKKEFNQYEVDYLKLNGDQLLQHILAEYKEKVVLFDFWSTTCGPCLMDFKLMKDIKEKFKGKEIVFVYLCAQSSEKNWQHIIQKYEVEGEHHLLTTKQYYDLQKKLKINAYPTYLLLDKKGSLIRNVPRPTDAPNFVRFLTHYLEN